jgi:LacI family transcriptional regulator
MTPYRAFLDASSGRKRVLLAVSPILEESCAKILKGIAQWQKLHGDWDTFWDNEIQSTRDASWYAAGRWDGVISRHTSALQVEACARYGVPLIDVNNARPFPGVPNVALNNVAVGQLGGEHFIDRGFVNYGFCGYGNEVWAADRRDGFREAVAAVGRACSVCENEFPGYHPGADTPEWRADDVARIAFWLHESPKPLGVMACNDYKAIRVVQAAGRARLRVPEDVAVLGANDDEVRCELSNPPLSSVGTNHLQSGFRAAEALARMMDGGGLDGFDLVVDPAGVVSRHSTDILAVPDRKLAAAVRFIQQNACAGVTVDAVGRHAGLARTQLEQKFRRYFGRSPQAEIRRVQVVRIRQLLHETDLPLRTVAELVGIPSAEYLTVFFKRETGETPGRYRRRARRVQSATV